MILKSRFCKILAFFDDFLGCALPLIDTLSFQQVKGVKVVHHYHHIAGKFYWYQICGFRVLNFQMLLYQQKWSFKAAFGWFFWPGLPKILSILFEILTSDNMQDDDASDMARFYWSIKKWSKLGQGADFLFMLRVFLFMPYYSLWVTPQDFAKWKTLLKYISVVSFISIAYLWLWS